MPIPCRRGSTSDVLNCILKYCSLHDYKFGQFGLRCGLAEPKVVDRDKAEQCVLWAKIVLFANSKCQLIYCHPFAMGQLFPL